MSFARKNGGAHHQLQVDRNGSYPQRTKARQLYLCEKRKTTNRWQNF